MIDDDSCKPSPVRVLCADGVFAPDAPPEVREKYAGLRDLKISPKRELAPFYGPPAKITPGRATGIRDGSRSRPIGRPRTRPVRIPTGKPRGAWNRKDDCTVERILELQREGLTADQIGERLGCKRHTVYGRLRNAARSSGTEAQKYTDMRTCACGRRKWATREKCAVCGHMSGAARRRLRKAEAAATAKSAVL